MLASFIIRFGRVVQNLLQSILWNQWVGQSKYDAALEVNIKMIDFSQRHLCFKIMTLDAPMQKLSPKHLAKY